VVFTIHLARKRNEAHAEVLVSAAAARVAEMEQLVNFGKALGESLTYEAIDAVATTHFPLLTDGRPAWAMVRSGRDWSGLGVTGDRSLSDCEWVARRALGDTSVGGERDRGDACFPMIVAGETLEVFGVAPVPPLTEPQRVGLATAAALLAVSLKNAQLFQMLHETSVRDVLTGCANRARRSKLPLSLIMFDFDRFKQINDRFGHLCGDAVLAAIGERMNAVLRSSGLKCRYGGEEFLVLLPDTTLVGARRVTELLRGKLEERPVGWNESTVRVTASFGLTVVTPGELDIDAIIGRADAALYRAKENGRNCIYSE
jgi:diguanylate cyclase (GGDEF)-like protein